MKKVTKEKLVRDVYSAFKSNNWEFEAYGVPELEDVLTVVDTCVSHLHDKPEGTVIEVGNISMRKSGDNYDFYIRLGRF